MTDDTEYSSDELNPPAWLNKSFFQKAVCKYLKDETVTVTDLALRPGTKPGEHYASVMFRAAVTYDSKLNGSGKLIKLILKTMPETGAKLDMLKETSAFKTEMRMYEEVLPEMQRLLAKIGDKTIIAPTLVYQSNDPAPVIIFIDEGPNGFKPYETPLNYEQVQVVADRIAKFHACSVYMNDNGHDLTSFDECPYEKVEGRLDFLTFFFLPSVFDAVKSIREWEGCESYLKIFEKNLVIFEERIREIFTEQKKQPYQILVHGDFQFKNMIYRNEGVKNEDFLLLDFQFCYWNTPGVDVLALLYNIGNESVRQNHRNDVIRKYFEVFQETLITLGYKGKIPRLLELQIELLRCGLMEYMFLLVFVPFQYIDFSKVDINKMVKNKDFHSVTKHVFHSKEYKEMFLERVQYLIDMGAFE